MSMNCILTKPGGQRPLLFATGLVARNASVPARATLAATLGGGAIPAFSLARRTSSCSPLPFLLLKGCLPSFLEDSRSLFGSFPFFFGFTCLLGFESEQCLSFRIGVEPSTFSRLDQQLRREGCNVLFVCDAFESRVFLREHPVPFISPCSLCLECSQHRCSRDKELRVVDDNVCVRVKHHGFLLRSDIGVSAFCFLKSILSRFFSVALPLLIRRSRSSSRSVRKRHGRGRRTPKTEHTNERHKHASQHSNRLAAYGFRCMKSSLHLGRPQAGWLGPTMKEVLR